jgi:hypothetical protein
VDSSSNENEVLASFYGTARLSGDDREIRLLTILLSRPIAGKSQCELKRVSLNESPKHEALSYTWGPPNPNFETDPKERAQITIERKTVTVTPNLEALRYLRHEWLERDLWVDAVCINQSDILERNQQVSQMKSIYESAGRVLIWFGGDALYSNEAMEFVGHFDRIVTSPGSGYVFGDLTHEGPPKGFAAVKEDYLEEFRRGRLLMDFITERSWWSRAWIVQSLPLPMEILLWVVVVSGYLGLYSTLTQCGIFQLAASRGVEVPKCHRWL